MKIKVIQDHLGEGQFPAFPVGTKVEITGDECAEFRHWFPCNLEGHDTYIPESFIDDGVLAREYNPTELVQKMGDILTVREIVNAWLVAENEHGQVGWIPAEAVVSLDDANCTATELAELKKRFGIDKQEEFLKVNANITLKEFAQMLHGRACDFSLTPDELELAKQKGFVVVYGESDDRVEFVGAISAEGHTNPLAKNSPAGILALSGAGELLDEDSITYKEHIKQNRNAIKIFYFSKDGLSWAFETDIPHETFLTYEGGYDEDFADIDCGHSRCVVFALSSLKK